MAMDSRYSDGAQFLKDVTIKIQNRLNEIDHDLSEGKKEIENMHEYYWENYTEMDQYGYEEYDNRQALLQQTNANTEKLKLKHRFEKMKDSPFSGIFLYRHREFCRTDRHDASDLRLESAGERSFL